jgi:hypothetical protein
MTIINDKTLQNNSLFFAETGCACFVKHILHLQQ